MISFLLHVLKILTRQKKNIYIYIYMKKLMEIKNFLFTLFLVPEMYNSLIKFNINGDLKDHIGSQNSFKYYFLTIIIFKKI